MKAAHDIIIRPIISERSMEGITQKRYTFQVANSANKIEIARAIEALFGVKVAKVNTMNVRGRAKRVGTHMGRKPDWKKAIVTLEEKSKNIEFFEGMA